jgi:hypothetical protein
MYIPSGLPLLNVVRTKQYNASRELGVTTDENDLFFTPTLGRNKLLIFLLSSNKMYYPQILKCRRVRERITLIFYQHPVSF